MGRVYLGSDVGSDVGFTANFFGFFHTSSHVGVCQNIPKNTKKVHLVVCGNTKLAFALNIAVVPHPNGSKFSRNELKTIPFWSVYTLGWGTPRVGAIILLF